MRGKRTVIFLAILAASAIFGGGVLAVAATPSTTPQDSTTLPERLAQRKAAYKVQLTAAQQKDIASKCQVAQTGLQQLKTKESPNQAKRQQIYADLTKQLATTIDHLKRQSINTVQVEANQAKFVAAVNQFYADAASYDLAVDDTIITDCVTDSAGFRASLLDARQLRTQLSTDSAAIKATVPALKTSLTVAQQALIKVTGTGDN